MQRKHFSLLFCSTLSIIAFLEGNEEKRGHCCSTFFDKNEIVYYAEGAYTYWTAREEVLETTLNYLPGLTGVVNPPKGVIALPPFRTVSGFKVGLGAFSNNDSWNTLLEYTWFRSKNNNFPSLNLNSEVVYSTVNSLVNNIYWVYSASAQWNLTFNRIGWQLGRSFSIGKTLTLNPFLGLLAAWDKQWFNVQYLAIQFSEDYAIFKNKQSWWSIGPYVGFENNCQFFHCGPHHLSFFADCGLSLGWGVYKTKVRSWGTLPLEILTFAKKQANRISPMGEITLGLRYESLWKEERYLFFAQVGWELQTWFGHNQMFPILLNTGNMSLQGLTIKGAFGF